MSINYYGTSFGHHDAALSLIDDNGDILFAGHSERYSGEKFDKKLNDDLIAEARTYANSTYSDRTAYYEKSLAKTARELLSFDFRSGKEPHPFDILIKKGFVPSKVGIFDYKHHLSHAAAGFQTSPFDEAVVVVIDAIGEWDTATIWKAFYDENTGYARYKKIWRMRYPKSIGLLYSAVTDYVGLKPLHEEYILMGMAAYGQPIWADRLKEAFVDGRENAHKGLDPLISDWFIDGVDPRRDIGEFDLAASVQKVTEEWVLTIMKEATKVSKNLVFMGGVALNCVLNSKIANEMIFDDIWIMPNPGDAGSSLGCAALTYGKKLNWKTPMLGTRIGNQYPVREIMQQLLTKKIVGVANGRAEFGPRALGNRSLLADPRGAEIKDKVNEIKKRQQFRPFAPAVLAEELVNQFEMPGLINSSPYMQYTALVRYPTRYPAIMHYDYTSRPQSVTIQDNVGFRRLLEVWHEETGCPMLLNTSLNIRGKPMVNTIADAKEFESLYEVKVCT